MVVSHRESSISSNIRAIIEQLNLNPVERRRLIERHDEIDNCRILVNSDKTAKVTIGVYGIRSNNVNNNTNKHGNQNRSTIIIKNGNKEEKGLPREDHVTVVKLPRKSETGNGIGKSRAPTPKQRQRIQEAKDAKNDAKKDVKKDVKDEIVMVEEVPRKESSTTSTPEFVTSSPKQQQSQDLPELPGGNLNHTAAHHRIHVRPKNRRPPRRSNNTTGSSNNDGSSTSILSNDQINTTSTTISSNSKIADDVSEPTSMIDGLQGTMQDSLEPAISTLDATFDDSIQAASSPIHVPPPPPPEIPHKPTSILRKSSSRASRTSLENGITLPTSSPVVVVPRKPPLSPDSLDTALQDASAKSSNEQLDQAPPPPPRPSPRPTSDAIVLDRRRPNRLSKSPDSLESGEWPPPRVPPETSPRLVAKPVAAARRLLLSKSSEIVCSKSSDSLEGLNSSDDSMERQTRRPPELISKSFETINSTSDQQHQQKRKRVTMSDVNLSRGGRIGGSGKLVWKSSEKEDNSCWRPPSAQLLLRPRTTTHSSESSDNLEYLDNQESKQRARRSMPCNVICGITRKPSTSSSNCRLQKSSESSELGSTDTLDSERRHLKSSDSDETLDSLEKDLDQVMKSSPVGTPDEFVWRTSRTSLHDIGNKDPNVDLHLSLIGYNKTNENGNHTPEEERTGPQLTKKNKTMNNSMIQAKTEEDLQNMLNGNISEVTTTDTKSFKEKLIMFEKLGK